MQDTTHDVTARLVESEARYRAFIENASDMIQSVRPDGTYEFVNRAWFRKLGYTPDDLPRLTIWNLIHPDSLEHCQELFQRVMQGQTIEHLEAVFLTRDGTPLPIEGNATPRLVDGVIVATHSFFRDVSERFRAFALEVRNAELEREQRARYLEKMAALGKLSAGLSHELNNPASAAQRASEQLAASLVRREAATRALAAANLAPAIWEALAAVTERLPAAAAGEMDPLEGAAREDRLTEWLQGRGIARPWDLSPCLIRAGLDETVLLPTLDALPPPLVSPAVEWIGERIVVQELTDIIRRSTHRISDLVGAVKSYSHMDRATELLVDVHDGLEDTFIILGHRLKNMTVRRRYDRTVPRVRALGNGLNQVWTNIIDNAVDATGGQGTITVTTGQRDGRVVVELRDDGSGIPPAHLSRIFEPFFSTKPQGEGTGLGLDTVWRIISEEHRGTVDVESKPGDTLFRVSLPTTTDAAG